MYLIAQEAEAIGLMGVLTKIKATLNYLYTYLFTYRDSVSPCAPDWPEIPLVDQVVLELRDLPVLPPKC